MEGRVVVITGASGNLGPTAARAFAAAGARLVLVGTNDERLRAVADDLQLGEDRVIRRTADLTSPDDATTLAADVEAACGRVDVVLHLIGGYEGGTTVVDTPVEAIEALLRPHLWATLHVAKAFVPLLTRNGWGRFICVSSPAASDPSAKQAQYAVAKAAEEALVMTLAKELRGTGVTANVIVVKEIGGRGTSAEDIAAAMLYLCGDAGGAINGARLPLHGATPAGR
jgi:3-oxoacyl-[acyl-carrier protein] reductase